MIIIYRILFLPLLCLLLPYYVYTRRGRKDLWQGCLNRLGLGMRLPRAKGPQGSDCHSHSSAGSAEVSGGPARPCRLWVQAVSVGELQALRPLLEAWLADPAYEVVLTTTTSTAYALAQQQYGTRVRSLGFWGLDFWLFRRWQFAGIDPDAVVLTEADWWPELLHQAALRNVPVILLNARVSPQSFRRFYPFRAFTRPLLEQLALVTAASQLDYEHLLTLGAHPDVVHRVGNLKLATRATHVLQPHERLAARHALGFYPLRQEAGQTHEPSGEPLVLLGSSTWPGEEVLLLEVVEAARKRGHDVRLLLVPRHPQERRAELRALCEKWGLPATFHTSPCPKTPGELPLAPAHVYVVDTVGELPFFTQLADVAYIGKTLAAHPGGQSPVEAVTFGVPAVAGPCTDNFADLYCELAHAGALCQTRRPAEALLRLIEDAAERAAYASRAVQWHTQQADQSVRRTLELIKDLRLG